MSRRTSGSSTSTPAHERVRFNRLKENTEPVMRQTLLTPAAVSLTAEEYTAVLEHLDILAQYGFACEDFGDGTVLVREVPSDLDVGDIPATVQELAADLMLCRADPEGARDHLLQTMACKSPSRRGCIPTARSSPRSWRRYRAGRSAIVPTAARSP